MIGRGILKNPFLAHDIRASQGLPALRSDIPASLEDRLRLAIQRYALLTQDKVQSGFVPNRVKQWVGMVREISGDVPRQIITAVKHARNAPELLEMIHL